MPAIYTKLIEVDKVDLLLGPYATNMIAAAIPVIAQRKLMTIGMLGLAANSQFHYKGYFSMLSYGANPAREFSRGFFELAKAQNPKPKTVAHRRSRRRVRQDVDRWGAGERQGGRVHRRVRPALSADDDRFGARRPRIKAANPDMVFAAAYPPDTVAFVRAANEVGLAPKMIGGTLVGMLVTPLKVQLGPLMNGWLNNAEVFLPEPTLNFPGVQDVLTNIGSGPRGRASIHSGLISRRSAMRPDRCWRPR